MTKMPTAKRRRVSSIVPIDALPKLDDPQKAVIPLFPFGGLSKCRNKWRFKIGGVCLERYCSPVFETFDEAKRAYNAKCREWNAFAAWYWVANGVITIVHRNYLDAEQHVFIDDTPEMHSLLQTKISCLSVDYKAGRNNTPYAVVSSNGKKLQLHRLVLAQHGYAWRSVDHINGNGLDNRLVNLRSGDHGVNSRNMRLRLTSQSGTTGVHYKATERIWVATLTHRGHTESHSFAVGKYGFSRAKRLAISTRRQMAAGVNNTNGVRALKRKSSA